MKDAIGISTDPPSFKCPNRFRSAGNLAAAEESCKAASNGMGTYYQLSAA